MSNSKLIEFLRTKGVVIDSCIMPVKTKPGAFSSARNDGFFSNRYAIKLKSLNTQRCMIHIFQYVPSRRNFVSAAKIWNNSFNGCGFVGNSNFEYPKMYWEEDMSREILWWDKNIDDYLFEELQYCSFF